MTSTTRSRERFRCNNCDGRWAHKKKAKRDPKCPHCGEAIRIRSDEVNRLREMENKQKKGRVCNCNAYPFPHEIGSFRMCDHHSLVKAGTPVTDDEWLDYKGCLATPRTSFM